MSIQVSAIRKKFGDFLALDGVDLDFPSGKLISLLGPSGCGKTTLLRIIAGLDQPDSGRVILNDRDASALHVRDRRVGFVFQHYALFRHMTIFDNVAFGLRMRPRRNRPSERLIREKVMELLKLVQLDWVSERYPAQLSGGQRQRIALARALAVDPCVLLLDEPFGALDAQVRKELRRWLRRLHDELPVTSIFVTHDQEEALEVADQIVLMNRGRIEQVGTPNDVYHRPETPFVAGFIGSFNMFHARAGDDGIYVDDKIVAHRTTASAPPTIGNQVLAFARPHEIDIVTDPDATSGIPAEISRILNFGLTSRIELKGLKDSSLRVFDVEVLKQQVRRQNLRKGQHVRLMPSETIVFDTDTLTYDI